MDLFLIDWWEIVGIYFFYIVEDLGFGRRYLECFGMIGYFDMIFLLLYIYEFIFGGVGFVCSDGNWVVLNKKRKEIE